MSKTDVTENDIAIVGMAARLPGAKTIDQYWDNLVRGVESVRFHTDEELLARGEAKDRLRNPKYVRAGATLEDLELFDGEFFGFSPKESAILDPQHRIFTEACWEALENAGHPPDKFSGPIGIFGGCGFEAYFALNVLRNPELMDSVGFFLLRHTGNDKDFLVTRVSYLLDLKGPSVNVQTACSTSLVAAHLACQSLLSGECDMALAGGVTIEIPHGLGYIYREGEVLSPDGHCHAFDHRGQGTVFGSGAGVVCLRRATDAVEDGDHIHAIIKGSAVNNDGSSKVGYLAPSVDGQAAAMSEAYVVSGVDPDSIGYVECHGTGTYLGDPIELSAMTQAFRQQTDKTQFCRIGSVKTNIGHLDTAAGVASLIKASLALRHGKIPPSLNFEAPNPNIDFENSPFKVNTSLYEWPNGAVPRRAAVNSLGVGGTNAHMVVQQPPVRAKSGPTKQKQHILPISARTKKALDQYQAKLVEHLKAHPEQPLADIAYTLLNGRKGFEQRRVVVASDHEEAARVLADNDRVRVHTHSATTDRAPVVFMFTGGGSQYPNMAKGLYETEPTFRDVLDRGFAWLKKKTDIDYKALMFPPAGQQEAIKERMGMTSIQLPLIFLVEVGLSELWQSWGVKPEALVGHSLGENIAAVVSGVIGFEDGLGLVLTRGQLIELTEEARMVSVQLPQASLEPLLEGKLDLATVNAPDLCVVSGTIPAVEWLEAKLDAMEVDYRRLKIKAASHTRTLDPILPQFGDYLRSIPLNPPKIPFVSNKSGKWITNEEATDPEYWVQHLRNTIRFADCVQTLMEKPGRVFLELGPGRTLSSLVRGQPSTKPTTNVINSLPHPSEDVPSHVYVATAFGRLWASGAAVDIGARYEGEKRQRVELPTYAWQHQPYWVEAGAMTAQQDDLRHLERFEDTADWWYRPYWSQQPLDDLSEDKVETWLLFLDEAGIGAKLAERLRARGQNVVVVHAGDAYHRQSADEYVLVPERGREEYDVLIQDLVSSGRTPSRIVHLWTVTVTESFRMGSSFFHRNQEQGFYSLLFLSQAIADENLPRPIHMTVVSSDMQKVHDEVLKYPEKATILGPVKVIPREMEGIGCSAIDVELPGAKGLLDLLPLPKLPNGRTNGVAAPTGIDGVVDQVEREVTQPPANQIIAYRHGQRYVQRHVRRRPKATEGTMSRLKKDGVYVITGGLGGIGLTFAEHLAAQYQARLVLIGRTELPEKSGWDVWIKLHGEEERVSQKLLKVKALEAAGAEVMVGAADVTDVESMKAIFDEAQRRFGRIDGVLHAAGVTNDELIQMKRQATVEDTFAPKIHGTLMLDRILEDVPLDFVVLFSSTSTVIAPPGQVDYVAANAYLNAFAQAKSSDERPYVVAMNWGIWNEVGLAAETIREMVGERKESEPRPASHPLFHQKINDGSDDRILRTTYDVSKMWVLNEHRTKGGIALLPGTGYLELARAALAEFGETDPFEIRDLFFLRPLRVDEGAPKSVEVRLKPTPEGYDLVVRSEYESVDKSGWEQHGQARLLMRKLLPVVPVDVASVAARCGPVRTPADTDDLQSQQERFLRFGPRWRVLRRAAFGKGEAYGELSLQATYLDDLGEWKLHPAVIDLATGFAMDLIDGYAGEQLWVPVSYRSIKVFGDLPQQVRSWVRNRGENTNASGVASFDITICDPEGNVVTEIEDFSIKRLEGDPEAILSTPPAANEIERKATGRTEGQLSPTELQLRRNMEQGILPAEGIAALERVLHGDLGPQMVISSMDLELLVRQAEQTSEQSTTSETKFARPELDSEYLEPRDEIERTLVSYWEDLLGVDRIGVKDSFFDLGGHSLIAVRLFAQVRKAFQVDYPISVLFEAPTVEEFASLIKDQIGDTGASTASNGTTQDLSKPSASSRTRYMHLVPMNQDEATDKTPFFLVAGMFGNVLNLRNLAGLVGRDRPFYGLQARGLFGDQEPHETFEEAARDYIEEMRTVQPKGPYLLGGFSGGGITAYEIAQQLLAAGDEVAMLVMLDTILPVIPDLSPADRAKIQMIELKSKGPQYFAEWAENRMRWEVERLKKRLGGEEEGPVTPQFQNDAIEAAFRAALPRYEVKPYPGRVILFRPKLDKRWTLGPERFVSSERLFVYEDNGWGQHVGKIDVYEVPGDHDSMVLEPNVRIVAKRLRKFLDDAEEEFRQREVREAIERRAEL